MSCTVSLENNTYTVSLSTSLDAVNAVYLDATRLFPDGIDHAMIVDFSAVQFMDSTGVSALIGLLRAAQKARYDFSITGLQGQPKSLADVLKLGDAVKIKT